jgi:hypothetical protein
MMLFGSGMFGKSANVTSESRVNAYIEIQPGDDRAKIAIYATPGLELFLSFGDTPVRGLYPKGDYLYAVHRGTFWEINNAGTATNRGSIGTTSGRVYMADNGSQLMLTDGTTTGGYIYDFSTLAFTQIADIDYPGAGTVTWMDSYFVVNKPNSQRYYVSAANDGLTWDALDFASAESNPDDLVAVAADNSNLYLYGTLSTEFDTNSGGVDFPFTRISGGATEWGCAAAASVVKFDNSLAFLAKNKMGQVWIARMTGYRPEKISTPELDYIINNYSSTTDASFFSYMLGGHPMLQCNFNTGGGSWLYDGLSKVWSQLKSYGITRHRGEIACNYLNQTIVSDYSNGNLYSLKASAYADNGQELAMELITRHIAKNDNNIRIDKLQLDMETGVGLVSGQGSDPQIMMSVSKDGGHTYGPEQWVTMGAIGKFRTRAIWRRLGAARDWTFKFRITDPVKRVIFDSSVLMKEGSG